MNEYFFLSVRVIGLEPTRLTTPDPKSGAATNYATRARSPIFIDMVAKIRNIFQAPKDSPDYSR